MVVIGLGVDRVASDGVRMLVLRQYLVAMVVVAAINWVGDTTIKRDEGVTDCNFLGQDSDFEDDEREEVGGGRGKSGRVQLRVGVGSVERWFLCGRCGGIFVVASVLLS